MKIGEIASTAVEAVEKAGDTRVGKWVSIAGIVASLVTGAVNMQSNYYHHKEAMRQMEDVKRQVKETRSAVEYIGGTDVVAAAAQQEKEQNK